MLSKMCHFPVMMSDKGKSEDNTKKCHYYCSVNLESVRARWVMFNFTDMH